MKKRKLIFIVFLMSIALIGLIIIQVNWIRHDLNLQEQQFNQQVTNAMNKAVGKLETKESVQIVTHEFPWALDDSIIEYFKDFPPAPPEPPSNPAVPIPPVPSSIEIVDNIQDVHREPKSTHSNSHDSIFKKKSIRIISNAGNGEGTMTVSVNAPNANEFEKEIEANQVKLSEDVKKVTDHETEFEKDHLIAREEEMKMKQASTQIQLKRINKVLNKMEIEYNRKDFNLLSRLDPHAIDSIVGIELKNNGIKLPYSISLYSTTNDSTYWKRSLPDITVSALKKFEVNLFPEDIVAKKDFMRICFADTLGYFLSSMWLMLISSAFFTMVVLWVFSYTFYIIFRQKKLDEIRNDFINNMTHEFKTPIATIRLASEAINNPEVLNDTSKIKFYSAIIKNENDRMNSHVETILQMAQFDKKAFAPDLTETDIHEVINESINKFSLLVTEKGGKINFQPNAVNCIVNADRSFIMVVIMNLLDNAVKYCDSIPEITIETFNSENNLIISICDNGIGMDKPTQKLIFEKFYRLTSGNLHNVKGFGLGLSYVKAIVAAHNGTISVSSDPGKGSRFDIRIPVNQN